MNIKKSFKELKDAWVENNAPKLSDFEIGGFVKYENDNNNLMEIISISEEKKKILTKWIDVAGNQQYCWFSPKNLIKEKTLYVQF